MSIVFFALAIVCMGVAHFIRVLRWELFVSIYEKPDRKRLLASLAFGYLINYFVPYKLGDIFKGFFAGWKMKSGKALGLSTVIVDRYLDVFAVGLIFTVLFFTRKGLNQSLYSSSRFYLILFGILVAVTVIVYALRGVLKKLIKWFSGLFNDRIEVSILTFAWALILNFKDIFLKIKKVRLIAYTVMMWGVYILSYFLFALSYSSIGEEKDWIDIFMMLFGENGLKASTMVASLFSGDFSGGHIYMLIYMMAPLLLIIMVSLIMRRKADDGSKEERYLKLLPQMNAHERLVFLDKYFSNESRDYIANYLKINHNISIVRDYSAGSNATTILCVDEKGMFFRKYAFGEAGEKLFEQIEWIRANSAYLPLPEIIRYEKNEMYCYYDMPYSARVVGMFEFIHSMPIEESWRILREIFGKLETSIYRKNVSKADKKTIDDYIEKKVRKNIRIIKENKRFRSLLEYDDLIINGKTYHNLGYYEKMLSEENLSRIFADDTISVIHGDLTIENIVCMRDEKQEYDFYLIDPNTGNLHDSPFLDLAKLLQSLHGGYEFLMAVKNVTVEGDRINFIYAGSHAYSEIFERVMDYLNEHYSKEQVRSIFYHEIVHWLRLMPYKLEKDIRTAPVFYAGLLMVLNDINDRFSERKNEQG